MIYKPSTGWKSFFFIIIIIIFIFLTSEYQGM